MDTNKDLNKVKLSRSHTQVVMRDLVNKREVQKGPATYFRGKNKM